MSSACAVTFEGNLIFSLRRPGDERRPYHESDGRVTSAEWRSHICDARRTPAGEDRAGDGDVGEFASFTRGTQEQAAPAHVTAADEIAREDQPVAKSVEEDIAIFRRRDAAEENGVAVCRQFGRQRLGVATKRPVIARIVGVNVDLAET